MIRSGTDACRYDNRGRLIKFGTTLLEYDNYGNRTKKGDGEVYEWERGNKLKRIIKYPHTEIECTYDYTGKRSTKSLSVGGRQEEYIQYHYDGNNLVGEDRSSGKKLRYFYDAQGICGFRYDNSGSVKDIVYVKNVQGDVEFLQDSNGTVLARYDYDAWGNCSLVFDTDGIGALNPIRYRSYYYDVESKLYYLMARYYDPETTTFISPDTVDYLEPETIGVVDLYAYCLNNPISYTDPSGHSVFLTMLIIGIVAGAAIGGTMKGVSAYNDGQRGWGAGGAIMGGVMGGTLVLGGAAGLASVLPGGMAIAGFGLSAGAALGISAVAGVGAGLVSYSLENCLRTDREWIFEGFVKAGFSGGFKAAATFGIGFMGGRMGAFDKMVLNPMLKGATTLSRGITYGMAKYDGFDDTECWSNLYYWNVVVLR